METVRSCRTASLSELMPNGYLARVFPSCPEVEGLAEEVGLKESKCDQSDLSPREESGQNKKKTKVNKIWNFMSRRKGASSQGKRPQSMILLGDTSKPSELKPKVTLMDRMKSFKRLKPLTGASKNTAHRSSKAQEPQEPSSIYRMRKAEEASKPFRHSYAGHTESLEPFLADAQGMGHTPNRVSQKVLDFNDLGIQVEEDPWEEEATEQLGSGRRARRALKSMFPVDHETPHSIQELEVAIEDSNLEGNVEGGYEERHVRRDKATPFGGVVKFFSNVAEVARKWRAFSREEPQMGRRCRHETYLVRGSKHFILEGAASQASFPLGLPSSPHESELWGGTTGKHRHPHLKALQSSCTFEMSIESEETSGQALAVPCTTASLALASTSAVFEFQDDPVLQNCYSYHYGSALTGEHSSSEDLEEDTETLVTFLKEDDSTGESSPELGTCVRTVTTEAVVEKLQEKPSKMEKQEAGRGPMGSSQAEQPQESDLGMGAADTEMEAIKACTGVSSTQAFFPPAEPSPRTPPLKILLAKCHSLPISQSISMELDQLGWRRPRKLCTGSEPNPW
ncbi:uncharacterized protein RBU33_014975 [Hipposideros larvatus]